MILVIDDERIFKFEAEYHRTSKDGIAALNRRRKIDELWLDHDLSGVDKGTKVTDWLAARAADGNPVEIGRIVLCTANPSGADTMCRTLRRWDYNVVRPLWSEVDSHIDYLAMNKD
jgi:hypothetical protein